MQEQFRHQPKTQNAAIKKKSKIVQSVGGHCPYPNVPPISYKDLARPERIANVFEPPKSINAFWSYKREQKLGRSMGRPGTYKLALIQALSLTTVLRLWHGRVNRV